MNTEPLGKTTRPFTEETAGRHSRMKRWAAASGGIVALAVGAACWFSANSHRSPLPLPVGQSPSIPPATSAVSVANVEDVDVFDSRTYPEICRASAIEVSLGLLRQNGADLSKPMPCRHRVLAANRAIAERVGRWAQANDFSPTPPELYHEHGGVERFQIDLVRTVVPSPDLIEDQGLLVHAGMKAIPGTAYQSWMGEIIR